MSKQKQQSPDQPQTSPVKPPSKFLSKLLPDGCGNVNRSTLLVVSEVIAWLHDHKPDALKAAMQAVGHKEVRDALNDLEDHVEWWR